MSSMHHQNVGGLKKEEKKKKKKKERKKKGKKDKLTWSLIAKELYPYFTCITEHY